MKVLVAEDEESVRERVIGLVAGVADAQLHFVEQDAAATLRRVAVRRPDVVVLDVFMRGAGTRDLLKAIKKEWPGTAVVISAWVKRPDPYLHCGADAVLEKSSGWEELTDLARFHFERSGKAGAEGQGYRLEVI